MPAETQVSARTPRLTVRIEVMTDTRFSGAAEMQNVFLGARKAMCGVFSYRCCPGGASEFGQRYKDHPEKLAISAVAVREDDDSVVGLAMMTEYGMPRTWDEKQLHTLRPGECYLDTLSVAAGARGQGIGSKLLRWCEDTAVARGAEVLSLRFVAGNPAQRLYERKGFELTNPVGCCGWFWMFCFLGLPHCRCGGHRMEKELRGAGP